MIDRRTATMAVRFDSNADLERPQVCAVLMLMRTSDHASAQHGAILPHTLMRPSGPWSASAEGCGAVCTAVRGRGAWRWLHGRIILQPSPIRSRECGDSSDPDQKILRGCRLRSVRGQIMRTPSPKSSNRGQPCAVGPPSWQSSLQSPPPLCGSQPPTVVAARRVAVPPTGIVAGTLGGAETSTIHPACIAAGPHLYVSFVSSNTCP